MVAHNPIAEIKLEQNKGKSDKSALLCLARAVSLPTWATHVAVRNDGSKAEPAAWLEEAKDYIDEKPKGSGWVGSYKHCYWTFFSVEQLKT